MRFTDKQTLIVGGSSGMGLESARLLVEEGASVTLVGRQQDKLDRARETCGPRGKVSTLRCDLRRQEDLERLINQIRDEMKDLDFLINAAGVFSPKPYLEHTREDYDAYLDLNRATFFVTQQVAQNMAANGSGAIVNIGSMWAHQAVKVTPSSAYSMAMAGRN
jgi:short-subunit dehydrogenase